MPEDTQALIPDETVPEYAPAPDSVPEPEPPARRKLQLPEAFWRFATLFSFVVNLSLVIVLLVVAGLIFSIKGAIAKPLIGGLHTSFVAMDQAHIKTTILVSDTILVQDTMPVVFNLPLQQNTIVTLVQDTPVQNATIYLNNQPVPLDLVLKQGTQLGITLDLNVPVSQTIPVTLKVPVKLQVPVDIPLDQTELHQPFTQLGDLVGPYDSLLDKLPSSWKGVFGIK